MTSCLISRLVNQFGVDGGASGWLRSYLTNRSQYVKLGEHSSATTRCVSGVPQSVSVRSTVLHSVRVAGWRPHQIIRRVVSPVRRRHTVAGRRECQRRHTSPREARQLLGCCPVLVPAERSATQRGQVGGRHPRNSTSAPIGCHYPSGRGRRQQAAGCTQVEVARCNNLTRECGLTAMPKT